MAFGWTVNGRMGAWVRILAFSSLTLLAVHPMVHALEDVAAPHDREASDPGAEPDLEDCIFCLVGASGKVPPNSGPSASHPVSEETLLRGAADRPPPPPRISGVAPRAPPLLRQT